MASTALINEIKGCRVCSKHLPLGINPIFSFTPSSSILIIGQAPGAKVHASGIPWDDASGRQLRFWMGIDEATFYNAKKIALVPMGFCYPGKGSSGDLPPRPECAPLWHTPILSILKKVKLTILIGQYSQRYYLGENARSNLTETVRSYQLYLPKFLPLPHPSPRNRIWLKKNPWFEKKLVPVLQAKIKGIL